MKNMYKKLTVAILILVGIAVSLNFYLNSKKESIQVKKEFSNAISIKNDRLSGKVNIKIDATLSDTHFMYKDSKFSKDLKGTVYIDGKQYYIYASTSTKNGNIEGMLSKEKEALVSDFGITLTEDLSEICIYNGDYIIASPVGGIGEVTDIYNEIVDIPIE